MAKKADASKTTKAKKAAKKVVPLLKEALPIECPANQWKRRRTMEGWLRYLNGKSE